MTRMRSPNYPSLSLKQSVDMVAKIHRSNRANVVTREDAAQTMGYSGLTGRSMTVLAALVHFGLLAKAGKGDVKVTQDAVEILHGVDEAERNAALLKAAFAPQLFRDLHERFPDGVPSENAIRSYLIKQEFSDAAIGPAISAFMETYREVENIREGESYGDAEDEGTDSPEQTQETPMQPQPVTAATALAALPVTFANPVPAELNKINMDIRGDQVLISGLLDIKGLRALEKKIHGLKGLISSDEDEDDDSPMTGMNETFSS